MAKICKQIECFVNNTNFDSSVERVEIKVILGPTHDFELVSSKSFPVLEVNYTNN